MATALVFGQENVEVRPDYTFRLKSLKTLDLKILEAKKIIDEIDAEIIKMSSQIKKQRAQLIYLIGFKNYLSFIIDSLAAKEQCDALDNAIRFADNPMGDTLSLEAEDAVKLLLTLCP